MNRIFCHFGLFFAHFFEKIKKKFEDIIILHLHPTNDDYMMYGSWDMECNRQIFLSFWTIFCLFTPLTSQKIKTLKKWKKCLEILSFYFFFPFTSLTARKIKIFKKLKKRLEISSFYTIVLKSWSYAILFLRYGVWQI